MDEEELLDELFADLASDLVDLSDDEIKERILKYDLDPADAEELFNIVKDVQNAESLADQHTKKAQQMANEDNTDVKVTEEDKDSDGDTDKVTIEKETPTNDGNSTLTEEEAADLNDFSEKEDEPHDEKIANKTNQFAKLLGERRF